MKRCPPLEDWEAFVRGSLPDEQAAVMSDHLETCADCGTIVEQLDSHAKLAGALRVAVHEDERTTPIGVASGATGAANVPEHFEGYQVLRELSRTHFSIVYEAVQQGTGQRVAIKVLLASAAVDEKMRLRFEREVELLATLQHPGVVPIYDSGMAAGQYFFVMPFISGEAPDEFAQQRSLSVRDRLALARRICEAVAAAHQRGVIHRDLKPSNILVDATGQPHILDFGLAKMAESGRGDPTLTLDSGQILGTPAFMAPEQAAGETGQIDVRSDVYALGVILYRMLTGQMPYSIDGNLASILRNIQEIDARPPSAFERSIDADVDSITLRALAKEQDRRYQTATALADDMTRYLEGRPIEARRDSTVYVLRKYVRRHPGVSVAAVLIFALSIAFAASMGVMAQRLRVERDNAIDERDKAFTAIGFLEEVFAAADPGKATAGANPQAADEVTVVAVLDRAAERIDNEFLDRPTLQAALKSFLGRSYRGLTRYDRAVPLFESALAIQRRELGPDHADTLTTQNDLAFALQFTGQYDKAEPLLNDTLARRRQALGNDNLDTIRSMSNLGTLHFDLNRLKLAEPLYREALAGFERLGMNEDEGRLTVMNNLAVVLYKKEDVFVRKNVEEAAQLMRQTAEAWESVGGEAHPLTLSAWQNRAVMLRELGDLDESEALTRSVLDKRTRYLDAGHPDRILSGHHLARTLHLKGEIETAEETYRQFLADAGDGLPWIRRARMETDYSLCLTDLKRFEEAEAHLSTSMEIWTGSPLPTDSEYVQATVKAYVKLYDAWDRPDQAAAYRNRLAAAPSP